MTFAFSFPCTHNVLSLLNLFGESKEATMATVRIAVFLATFHIALGILNPCEYDYLPYIKSFIELTFCRKLYFFLIFTYMYFTLIEPLPLQVYHLQMYFSNAYITVFYN